MNNECLTLRKVLLPHPSMDRHKHRKFWQEANIGDLVGLTCKEKKVYSSQARNIKNAKRLTDDIGREFICEYHRTDEYTHCFDHLSF